MIQFYVVSTLMIMMMMVVGQGSAFGMVTFAGVNRRQRRTGAPINETMTMTKLQLFSSSRQEAAAEKEGDENPSSSTNLSSVSPLPVSLDSLLRPSTDCTVDRMSSTDLAYIGDAVYELFVRCQIVWPPKKTSNLQLEVVSLVRAEHQANLLSKLKQMQLQQQQLNNDNSSHDPSSVTASFVCTTTELQVLARGRNAVTKSSKNRKCDPAAYQDATALEALIGYLYITDSERCRLLLLWIQQNLLQKD